MRGVRRRGFEGAVAVLAALAAIGLWQPPAARADLFLGFGTAPGYSVNAATGVSSSPVPVASGTASAAGSQGFQWTTSGFTGVGTLYSPGTSMGAAVSSDGSTIVGSSTQSSLPFDTQAFRWTSGGGIVGLGGLGGAPYGSQAFGVSSDGSCIVGSALSANGAEAFRWDSVNGMAGLGFLTAAGVGVASAARGVSADGGVVVGYSTSAAAAQEAFRWTASDATMHALGILSGGAASMALAVSADGNVVVGQSGSTEGPQAFRWQAGAMVPLGFLSAGDDVSSALGVSGDGSVIVGSSGVDGGTVHAFLWTQAGGMASLQDFLTACGADLSGWTLSAATGVSSDGRWIVGYGDHGGAIEGFLVDMSAAPEPGTMLLAGLALAAGGLVRRRTRRK